jgi:hypothetical protein
MGTAMRVWFVLAATLAALAVLPAEAYAYIGPGAGISAIGAVVAFLAAIVFAIVGFVWYPVKRLRAAIRSRNTARREAREASTSS